MSDDTQILIARLVAHQTLRRDDKMVKRALSDELFRPATISSIIT